MVRMLEHDVKTIKENCSREDSKLSDIQKRLDDLIKAIAVSAISIVCVLIAATVSLIIAWNNSIVAQKAIAHVLNRLGV